MVEFIAEVNVFLSSLAARDTGFGGILSSPVDFLPSKDFNSCATYIFSIS